MSDDDVLALAQVIDPDAWIARKEDQRTIGSR